MTTQADRTAAEIRADIQETRDSIANVNGMEWVHQELKDHFAQLAQSKIAALESELAGCGGFKVGDEVYIKATVRNLEMDGTVVVATNGYRADIKDVCLVTALTKSAPSVGEVKLAAGDCVEYLVKEAELDQLAKERVYRPNGKYMVVIKPDDSYPAGKEIAAPVAPVATAGVVERIRDAVYECTASAIHHGSCNYTDFDAALAEVRTLPETNWVTEPRSGVELVDVYCAKDKTGWKMCLDRDQLLPAAAALVAAAEGGAE